MGRRRLLGSKRGGSELTPINSESFAAFEKSVDLAVKFGFTALQGCSFSRDYQYFFLYTGGSAVPHHVLNVVDINDIDTWTLKETWGSGDYRGGHVGNDGSKVYAGIGSLLQFNLTTPYLMSTRTQVASVAVGGGGVIKGVNMNPTETKLFINRASATASVSELRELDLSSAGNISGATLNQNVFTNTAAENGFNWVNNGNAILTIIQALPNATRIRTVTTPYTLSGLSAPITIPTDSTGGTDIEINGSQTKIYTIKNTGVLDQFSLT